MKNTELIQSSEELLIKKEHDAIKIETDDDIVDFKIENEKSELPEELSLENDFLSFQQSTGSCDKSEPLTEDRPLTENSAIIGNSNINCPPSFEILQVDSVFGKFIMLSYLLTIR